MLLHLSNDCLILRRMQQIVYTNNTEAARNTQTLGGKPIKSSEILLRVRLPVCPVNKNSSKFE